jgi:hypothetical protein
MAPAIQFLGTGSFFLFSLGVAKYLRKHYQLPGVQVLASSGGALAAIAFLTLRNDEFDDLAARLAILFGRLHGKPLALLQVNRYYREALELVVTEKTLPLLRKHLQIAVTTLPFLRRKVYIGPFATVAEVIEDLVASAYIPLYFLHFPAHGHWLEVDGGAAWSPIDYSRSLVVSAKYKPYSDIYITQQKISSYHFWSSEQLTTLYHLGYSRAGQRVSRIEEKLWRQAIN